MLFFLGHSPYSQNMYLYLRCGLTPSVPPSWIPNRGLSGLRRFFQYSRSWLSASAFPVQGNWCGFCSVVFFLFVCFCLFVCFASCYHLWLGFSLVFFSFFLSFFFFFSCLPSFLSSFFPSFFLFCLFFHMQASGINQELKGDLSENFFIHYYISLILRILLLNSYTSWQLWNSATVFQPSETATFCSMMQWHWKMSLRKRLVNGELMCSHCLKDYGSSNPACTGFFPVLSNVLHICPTFTNFFRGKICLKQVTLL